MNRISKIHLNIREYLLLLIYFISVLWEIILLNKIGLDYQIQFFNLVLILGIYLSLEEKYKFFILKKNDKFSLFSAVIFVLTIIGGRNINDINDNFFYLILPLLTIALCLYKAKKFNIFDFKSIILVPLFLPIRPLFFYIVNKLTLPLTALSTWFLLRAFDFNAVIDISKNQVLVGNRGVNILEGCSGASQMIFCFTLMVIFLLNYQMTGIWKKIYFLGFSLFFAYIFNIIRILILALITLYNDPINSFWFDFFHLSYGAILFTIIPSSICCYIFFKTLDNRNSQNN